MRVFWKLLLLALAVLTLSIAGCGSPGKSEEELKTLARSHVDAMAAGRYAEVVDNMSAVCAARLPPEMLGQAWESTASPIGIFVRQTEVTAKESGGKTTVSVICEFSVKELIAAFTFSKKGEIEGIWLSYGEVMEQPLESTSAYEEMRIEVGNGATTLGGKLTLPKGVEKPPVVVLVHGSGQHDMDETIGKSANKPFRDLAHGLAAQGIATIRYDKRYFVYPEEAQLEGGMTIEGEVVKDVTAALELAETDPRVDNNRVYLLGHSLGGMLAPKIAYDNPPVKGIISMAGSLRGLEDILLDQNIEALKVSGLSEEEQAKQLKTVEESVQQIKSLEKSRKTGSIFGQPAEYWTSLNSYQGEQYAKKLTIPMLVLQGGADFQCSVEKDYQSWRDALAGKSNVTYWVYTDLNHLFMKSGGVRDVTDYDAPATVEQRVIDDIAIWVKGH